MAAASSSGVTLSSYTISTSEKKEKRREYCVAWWNLKHCDEHVSKEME